jgi:hypothetical protein
MTSEKFRHKLGDVLTIIRDEPTNKLENAVPGGLLFGPRCRLGLRMSNSPLAVCVAFRATRFPVGFVLRKDFFASLGKGGGEGVNAPPWIVVDALEVGLVNEQPRCTAGR